MHLPGQVNRVSDPIEWDAFFKWLMNLVSILSNSQSPDPIKVGTSAGLSCSSTELAMNLPGSLYVSWSFKGFWQDPLQLCFLSNRFIKHAPDCTPFLKMPQVVCLISTLLMMVRQNVSSNFVSGNHHSWKDVFIHSESLKTCNLRWASQRIISSNKLCPCH